MKKVKFLFVIGLTISLITSCLNNKQTVDPVVIPTTTPSTGTGTTTGTTSGTGTTASTITCNPTAVNNTKDSVCFNTVILPFFSTNCASSGCHDSKTRAEGYDLSTYKSIVSKGIDLKNPKNSKLYTEMLNGMPPAPAPKLAKTQTDLVLKWITEGAKNVTCGVAVDTANVTFSKTIKPLLETNCVGCHKAGSISGGVLLDSYANVKAHVDNKKMWGAMNYLTGYSAMPPSQKLTDCQLSVVKKWIDNGAKND
jgi:cytochrome c5